MYKYLIFELNGGTDTIDKELYRFSSQGYVLEQVKISKFYIHIFMKKVI